MAYVNAVKGFIADTAKLDFRRCDGRVFHFDNTSTTSITPGGDYITINGGWDFYPLATIRSSTTLEASFASSEFTMDMFSMANSATEVIGDNDTLDADLYPVNTGLTVTIPFEIDLNTYYIDMNPPMNRVTVAPAASGDVQAVYTDPVEGTPGYTTLTFFAGDVAVGDEITVSYNRRLVSAHTVTVRTDSNSAMGELYIHWPVYADGADCTDSAIAGYVHFRIFRVRVSQAPGFDTSFKTAATNTITFTALNPRRADKRMYEIIYEELNSDGSAIAPDVDDPDYEFGY